MDCEKKNCHEMLILQGEANVLDGLGSTLICFQEAHNGDAGFA